MDELQVGDRVLTGDGTYSKVYAFSHKDASTKVTYLQILTESMNKKHPLEITGKHLLYVYDNRNSKKKLEFAQAVKVGDFLVSSRTENKSRVVSIRSIQRQGLYTPLTATGTIVVNGVVASVYASFGFLDAYLSEQVLHWLSHGGMAPYRLYCAVIGCQNETYDAQRGYSPWAGFLMDIQRILTSPVQSVLLKIVIVLVGTIPLLFSIVVGKILSTDSMMTLLVQVAALLVVFAVVCKYRFVVDTMSSQKKSV